MNQKQCVKNNEFSSLIETLVLERRRDFRRLLFSAVILPVAIAASDYAVLEQTFVQSRITQVAILQFVWYVVQIGLVGSVVGRCISHPLLRWIVFGWILLLVNILTLAAAMGGRGGSCYLLPAALISGQIGIFVVWLFLGDTAVQVRVPTMLVGVVVMFGIWHAAGFDHWKEMINELLVLQAIILAILCTILRFQKFYLARTTTRIASPAEQSERRALQFSLKHVLIWTTGMAVILGIARGFDLLNWQAAQRITRGIFFWKAVLAVMSASGIIVALWVALGRGHWLLRYCVGLVYLITIGSIVSIWSLHNLKIRAARVWNPAEWELMAWYELGWWLLGWLFLCSGLLASTLLILRTLDYRLMRKARGTSFLAPDGAQGNS